MRHPWKMKVYRLGKRVDYPVLVRLLDIVRHAPPDGVGKTECNHGWWAWFARRIGFEAVPSGWDKFDPTVVVPEKVAVVLGVPFDTKRESKGREYAPVLSAAVEVSENRSSGPLAGIEWVYDNLDNDKATARGAPSRGAWSLLKWVRESDDNRASFWEKLYPKLLPTRPQIDALESMKDTGDSVLSLVRRISAAVSGVDERVVDEVAVVPDGSEGDS